MYSRGLKFETSDHGWTVDKGFFFLAANFKNAEVSCETAPKNFPTQSHLYTVVLTQNSLRDSANNFYKKFLGGN